MTCAHPILSHHIYVSCTASTITYLHRRASSVHLISQDNKSDITIYCILSKQNMSSSSSSSFGTWVGHNLLFSQVLEADIRLPCMTFSVPNYFMNLFYMDNGDGGNEFGLIAPRIEFWIAMTVTLTIGALFSTCLSCIIYHFIILPRKQHKINKDEKRNQNHLESSSMTPLIVGFGIVMPLCALSPYFIVRYFLIKNKIIKFLIGSSQVTSFFRCSEAVFGFLPSNVEDSLSNLIMYNAFPVEAKFDSQGPIKSTWINVKSHFINWVKYIFILGSYSSIMMAYDYEPFPKEEGPALRDINLLTGFSYQQLINNLLMATMFQIYLTTFGFGINFITSLCGLQLIPFMLNPIFESSSVSDFWGKRWNLVVHGLLKRGVYKPVRSKYSRLAASTATFIASGVFHEWLLSIVFYSDSEDGSCSPICYSPGYGRNTLFFVWNSILIGLEYAIGGAAIFQLCRKHLPITLVSLMVASTALPTVHWFTNDYVRSDYFRDAGIGFPLIIRMTDE